MKDFEDDYLWDRSGEPDPEVQKLEQLLGTLRYQPRPLEIPAAPVTSYRRATLPRFLAIAATVVLTLLGVGLWLGLHKQPGNEVANQTNTPVKASPETQPAVTTERNETVATASPVTKPDEETVRDTVRSAGTSREVRRKRATTASTEITAEELKEAEAGREQLLLALRVASSKLNYAQKKAQEINSENQIHNQHKTG
jgi:hypothetical protein